MVQPWEDGHEKDLKSLNKCQGPVMKHFMAVIFAIIS